MGALFGGGDPNPVWMLGREPVATATPEPLPVVPEKQSIQGFWASMQPTGPSAIDKFQGPTAPPPPPSHWAYDPKQGVTWASPEKKGDGYEMVNNAPGSEGYNSFKGNRI